MSVMFNQIFTNEETLLIYIYIYSFIQIVLSLDQNVSESDVS